jgi:hypothetical protein
MANPNGPFGLMPIGRSDVGGCFTLEEFPKAVGVATAVYMFDVVRQEATGGITPGGTPGTDLFLGVAMNFGAASTLTKHNVVTDPFQVYEAQDDGSGAGILIADRHLNANLVFTAGDATLKRSKHQVAASTKAVTATLDVKLLQPTRRIGGPGVEDGAYSVWEVRFNKHARVHATVGV